MVNLILCLDVEEVNGSRVDGESKLNYIIWIFLKKKGERFGRV